MLISEEKCLDLTVYHYSEDQYWGEGGKVVFFHLWQYICTDPSIYFCIL